MATTKTLRYSLRAGAILVLAAGIAGLVWFIPWWHSRVPLPSPGHVKESGDEILRFSRKEAGTNMTRAVWEFDDHGHDSGYERETEQNVPCYYYFAFRNVLGEPAEMGFLQANCDCTSGDVCLLPPTEWQAIDTLLVRTPWAEPTFGESPPWHTLSREENATFHVPADGHGLLRLRWDGRKPPGGHQKANVSFWSRSAARPKTMQTHLLYGSIKVSLPILFDPPKASIGTLVRGETKVVEFIAWSPTRDGPQVSFQPREISPLFQLEVGPLSAPECSQLEIKLRADGKLTRVRAAFRVKATIREQVGDRQLDQGPFSRAIQVILDELPLESPLPPITGTIKGEVEVGNVEGRDNVQLGTFPAAETRVVVVPLFTEPRFALEPVSTNPSCLKAELKHNVKGSTAQRARWDLKVTVPADAWTGPLPEASAIVLRIPGSPPRTIRLPVEGTATR